MSPSPRDVVSGLRAGLGMLSGRWVLGGPRSVALGVSNVCNTRCAMCWSHSPLRLPTREDGRSGQPAFMDPALFESIIRQSHALGTFRVILGGDGDPALHPSFDAMLELMDGLRMEPFVMTNGLALDEGRAAAWAGRRAHVRFSLHAGDAETWVRVHDGGTGADFDRLSRVIRTLAGSTITRVSTMHVMHQHNFRGVREMVEHAHELGVDEILFRPARIDDAGPLTAVVLRPEQEAWLHREMASCLEMAHAWGIRTNLEDYLRTSLYIREGRLDTRELYRTVPCYVSWMYAEIALDGSLTPCIHSSRILGNLADGSLAGVWRSRRYAELRRECRTMPRTGRTVAGCRCDACCMAKYNLNIHNLLRLRSLRYGEA